MTKRRIGIGLMVSLGLIGLAVVIANPVTSSLITVVVLVIVAVSISPKKVAPATGSFAHLTEAPMTSSDPSIENDMGNMTWPFPSSDAGVILRKLDEIDRKLSNPA